MTDKKARTIFLKDYQVPDFKITDINLDIDLNENVTIIKSVLTIERNEKNEAPLKLHGEELILKSVVLNDEELSENEFEQVDGQLVINKVPDTFKLEITTEIKPQNNTALSGLYKSGDMYCTQCEAEGFRRITYYLDRPDVMAKFTTTLKASKEKYPTLLANGNLVSSGDLENGRHWATWNDPFYKPCYLFAMVAGNLSVVEGKYTTMSNRVVDLKLYVEPENINKTSHAMNALKKSMQWDEQAYGREYDLDIYMIVAVNDFNMGAMENKGLNIFNSKYILADNETATDQDFAAIDAVVGHEYFHNWSGNRVTLRDWFQLSLKEGFTVFREQQFSHSINDSPVSRIEDVELLRAKQFVEDSGPMAHPVLPDSYMEINNFYTLTIYEKGAEVIRMIHTILGEETFRKGADLYFAEHDGQAVTVEDFVSSMEKASRLDLSQFKLWYTQAGTPEITFTEDYNAENKEYKLTLEQTCPATPGQKTKKPMHIPITIGLLDSAGSEVLSSPKVLELKEGKQTFTFNNINSKPKLSLLRDFSAPVTVKNNLSTEDLVFLLKHEKNEFSRWNAGRTLCEQELLKLVSQLQNKTKMDLDFNIVQALKSVLVDKEIHLSLKAKILNMPTNGELLAKMKVSDPDAVYEASLFFKQEIAKTLKEQLLQTYKELNDSKAYEYNSNDVARRKLKNTCLSYLLLLGEKDMFELGLAQYENADNMTDTMAVLQTMTHIDCEQREQIFADFYNKWQREPLVINKWLGLQASSELKDTLSRVEKLLTDSVFDITNPNKVYALIGGFAGANPVRFHDSSGKGYKFLSEILIKLDNMNPQVAARMFSPFSQWQRFDRSRQKLMQGEMKKLKSSQLSRDMLEMVTKTLKDSL